MNNNDRTKNVCGKSSVYMFVFFYSCNYTSFFERIQTFPL